MADYLEDAEIERLLRLLKQLPETWEPRLKRLRIQKGFAHLRSSLIVQTEEGQFRIAIRQNGLNKDDFSVVLSFLQGKDNRWFRLRRYNGLHPPLGLHKNRIEKTKVRGFHIHKATHRYQLRAPKEDGFAEPTTEYNEVWGALELMIRECSFIKPTKVNPKNPGQRELF
jgi:hypothetical protein